MTNPGTRYPLLAPAMRPVLLIPLFGAVLILAVWAAVLARLSFDHDALFAHALADVESFVAGLEEHTVRGLRDVDRTALLVKAEFERDGTVNLPRLLQKGLIPVDGFVTVSATDSTGNVVASSHDFTSTLNVANREFFRVHEAADSGEAYIGPPTIDGFSQRLVIVLTRRLNLGDGSFGGVVMVAVDPRYFSDFYQERYLGRQGLLALLGNDGVFRVRRVGERTDALIDGSRALVLDRVRTAPIGSYRAPGRVDGVARFFAYRQLRDYPLILVVGRAELEVLGVYTARRRTYFWIAGLATAAIAVAFTSATFLFYRLRRNQKRAQDAEALFRAAAEGGLDAFFLLRSVRDERGNVVDFVFDELNPRATALVRLPAERVVGRRLSTMLRRVRGPELMQRYLRVLETGEPLDEEIELRPEGGESLWLREQVVRALDGLAVTARDITAQRQLDEQLRQQTAFLQTLIDHLPVGVIVRSARPETMGQIVLWNRACESIYGSSEREARGKLLPGFIGNSNADRVDRLDRDMLEHPDVQHVSNAPVDAPGRGRRFINFVRAPIFDRNRNVDFIISIVTDVTEEKARADELRLASKVFETTADAVLLSDADDRVIMVNQAFTDLTGFTADEVRGRSVQSLPFAAGHLDRDESLVDRLKREGRVTEELLQHRKDGGVLPCWATASCVVDEHGTVVNFVRVFSDISALKASQRQLEHLANYDTLTGLPNRRLFQNRLELALQRAGRLGHEVALLFIDLDGFKEVNDAIGHDVGDLLLREVSARLVQSVRASDTVSRLGGDEFTVIVQEASLPGDAVMVAERILEAIAKPFSVAGHRLTTSTSVGIAVYPKDGTDATTLLRNADVAMYRAKKAGRDRYELFTGPGPLRSPPRAAAA